VDTRLEDILNKGGQLFSSVERRIVFPFDTKAKETFLALFLKTNSEFYQLAISNSINDTSFV
jgi:hypothetical protein